MSVLTQGRFKTILGHGLLGPAAALFVSANIANAANLFFNMVFARLMGPAAFADLTLLLTLKLGVLSFLAALQFAFAEHTAKTGNRHTSMLQAHALSWRSLRISMPIMFIVIALANYISAGLNFSSPLALGALALAIPFFLPMIIYRGLSQGLIDVPKIILSIQAEWIIRLVGSIILWQMGFGLPGIAVAVGLSIAAGFVFSTDAQDAKLHKTALKSKEALNVKALGATVLPYVVLQAAQVLVLDSDILIAKITFSAESAGLLAGLLLIQRVFFFAFLSCSAILQPYIAQQKGGAKSPKDLVSLLLAIGVITGAALVIIVPNAGLVVKVMLGSEYAALTSIVGISALTGAIFIVSHLCAIYQIAKGQTWAAQIVLGFGIFQLISLAAVNHFFSGLGLHSYFSIKLAIQIICAICLLGTVMHAHKRQALEG